LEALHILATRNYSTWNKAGLISNWDIIGPYAIEGRYTKAELIEMTVEQEIKTQITEPALTEGWKNQVDYYLDLLISEMAFEDKVDLIVKGLAK
jgi:hypothetical protein